MTKNKPSRSVALFATLMFGLGMPPGCDDPGQRGEELLSVDEESARDDKRPEGWSAPAPSTQANEGYAVGALPGGAGASRTGAATYSIPLELPKGVGGFAPSASISYSSSGGSGLLGPGFGLGGLSSTISRCPRSVLDDYEAAPVRFDDSDAICLDGGRLELHEAQPFRVGGVYRQLREGFRKVEIIEFDGGSPTLDPMIAFKVTDRSGVQHFYGDTFDSRMAHGEDESAWARSRTVDTFGNEIKYEYQNPPIGTDTAALRLKTVTYAEGGGQSHQIELVYEDRDILSDGHFYGARRWSDKRLSKIVTSTSGTTLRDYSFTYEPSSASGRGLLQQVDACGYGDDGEVLCVPPTVFEWEDTHPEEDSGPAQDPILAIETEFWDEPSLPQQAEAGMYVVADITGDGDQEVIYRDQEAKKWRRWSIDGELGGVVVAETTRDVHQDKVLRPMAVDFDQDATAEILIPECELEPKDVPIFDDEGFVEGYYEVPPCHVEQHFYSDEDEAYPAWLPYTHSLALLHEPAGHGSLVSTPVIEVSASRRMYMVTPAADIDADGDDDLFICMGHRFETARWVLYRNRGEEGSLPSFDSYSTDIPCDRYDRWEGPSDIDGDGQADLLLARSPENPFINSGDLFQKVVVPLNQLDEGWGYVLDDADYDYNLWLEPTNLPDNNFASVLGASCAWANPYLVGDDIAGLIASLDFNKFRASTRGQGTQRWGDFNGDGNLDVLRFDIPKYSSTPPLPGEAEDLNYLFELCGGDGDIPAGLVQPTLRIWRNKGGSFEQSTVLHNYNVDNINQLAKEISLFSIGTTLADFNSDGTTDIEYDYGFSDAPGCWQRRHYMHSDFTSDLSPGASTDCTVQTATFEGTQIIERPYRTRFSARIRGGKLAVATLRAADAPPGAGPDDVQPTELNLRVFANRPTDKVVAVTDGLGERSEFEYAVSANNEVYQVFSDCDEEHRCLVGGSMWLLKALRRDAGMLAADRMHETSFVYADGRFGRFGRGFLGFGSVYSVTRDGPGDLLPINRSRALYDLSYNEEFRDYIFAGSPEITMSEQIVEVGGDTHREVSRTTVGREAKHALYAPGYFVTAASATSERAWFPAHLCGAVETGCSAVDIQMLLVPGGASAGEVEVDRVTSTTTTDHYGSVTFAKREHADLTEESTYSGFTYDEAHWLLGLPRATTTTSRADGEELTRSAEVSYDPVTRAVEYSIREPSSPELYLRTDYTRDEFGNVTSVVSENADGEQRSSELKYDATAGVELDWVENGLGHLSKFLEEPGTGLLLGAEEPNGSYVSTDYDALGRLRLSRRFASPESATTDGHDVYMTHSWDDTVSNSVYRVETQVLSGAKARTYFDRLGREVRTCWLGMSAAQGEAALQTKGDWICRDTFYDTRGNVSRVTVPFYEGTTPAAESRFVYDNVGRLIQSESPEHRIANHEYGFDRTARIDADGSRHSTVFDDEGRLWYTVDALGTRTCYEFGPFEQPKSVSRNCGYAGGDDGPGGPDIDDLEFEHDLYSNLLWSYDPDRGPTTYTYTPGFFDVDSVTDANGDTASYTYDVLGRVEEIELADGSVDIDWDDTKLGLVDEISGPGFTTQTFDYDQFLRTTSVTTHVEGDAYSLHYNYADGRLDGIDYPQGVSVDYAYDQAGYLRQALVDGDAVWYAEQESLLGMLERTSFGNGVFNVRQTDWDGFLASSTTTSPTVPGDHVEMMTYDWNHLGQLASRTDHISRQSQIFTYDVESRLRNTETFRSDSLVKTEDYRYDKFGNLEVKTDVGEYNYSYGGSGNRVADIAGVDYFWDDAGQLLERGEEEFTWTTRGRLLEYISNDDHHQHLYDGSGARVRTLDIHNDRQTTFIGGLYQESIEPDQTTHRFSIPAGDGIAAQFTRVIYDGLPAIDTLEYMHPDHLGSPSLTTNEAGLPERELMFDPWGSRRERGDWSAEFKEDASDTNVTGEYTGHEERLGDDLVNMNARYFDTRIGRAISADTIVPNALDGQSFNRFSYVQNNPLGFTDPTGHKGRRVDSVDSESEVAAGTGAIKVTITMGPWTTGGTSSGGEFSRGPWNPNKSLTGGESDADQIARANGDGQARVVGGSFTRSGGWGDYRRYNRGQMQKHNPPPRSGGGYAKAALGGYVDHLESTIGDTAIDFAVQAKDQITALGERAYINATQPHVGLYLAMDDAAWLLVDTYMALDATVDHVSEGDYVAAAASHLTAAWGAWQLAGMVEGVRGGMAAKGGGKVTGPDTMKPGPYARESIPARSKSQRFNKAERDKTNEIGDKHGCHTCGARTSGRKSGNWTPDHQPVSKTVPDGTPQVLLPHCKTCSAIQGGHVSHL